MQHRGPNDRGTHLTAGAALGVRRLSIVDVEGGHQPVHSEDKAIWAVQNGELYNHEELREQLAARRHTLTSRCDTEILPHLYEEYGTRFAKQLRGKFAIAIWDEQERRGVLARDRLGVKPLYYARTRDHLVFASELKSVLSSGLVDTRLDYDALDAYLTLGFFPGQLTPLAGVRKLLPGECLIVDRGHVRVERYWSYPTPPRTNEAGSADEWSDRLLAELDESVRLRLMSDVPLGAMLSGGLDSSLIVALMARHMSEPVKTFSVGFVEDGDDSELEDARFVANLFGTDHHELELSYARDTVDLEELVWHLDEPMAELSALGFDALCQLAAAHVTVALSGQGADELLGGYRKHQAASLIASAKRLRVPVERVASTVAATGLVRGRAARTAAARTPVDRMLAMSGRVDENLRTTLYKGPLAEADGSSARAAIEPLTEGLRGDPLAETLHIDGQLALVDDMLHYFDRTSMAHCLEVRVPFLDHHLVELCATIPSELKVRRGTTKFVLKQAARSVLPDRVVDKRKQGFLRSSSDAWLSAQLRTWATDYLLGADPRCLEFLERTAVERMVRRLLDGRGGEDVHLLLAILMLEVWLRTYVQRATDGNPGTRERISLAG
jgi:asparagine synthase (glutamine-hydrolysing)